MKKLITISILCVCFLAFYSCKKYTTVDIPISSLTIELDDIEVNDQESKALTPFYVRKKISYADLAGLSSDAIKYRDRIETIQADSVSIIITTTDGVGTVVKKFAMKVNSLPDYTIPEYYLGTAYTDDNIESYACSLLFQILTKESTTIHLYGITDVPSSKKLKVTITLEDVTMVAQLLKW